MITPDVRFYTTAQAAHALRLTPDRVRQLMRAGRIPHTETLLGRLLDADAVDAMALARSSQPRPTGPRGAAE